MDVRKDTRANASNQKNEYVLRRRCTVPFFAQIVVDTINGVLIENVLDIFVEIFKCFQIPSKWLFDDKPIPPGRCAKISGGMAK
jgi:hypothetical protein